MTDNIGNMQYPLHEGIHPPRTSISNRKDSPDNSSDDSRSHRGRGYPNERGRPLERERYPNSDRGRPPRREGLPSNGRPPDRYEGGPPDRGELPGGGGPLMMEDHQIEMEDPQDTLIEEDTQDQEDLLDQ